MVPIPEVEKDVAILDTPFVLTIINNHLSPDSLQHCQYVHKQIDWWNKVDISNPTFPKLKRKFTSPLYSMFLKMSWDRLRDKEWYEFSDFREYDRLKEADIRASFIFSSSEEILLFYENILSIGDYRRSDSRYDALDFIVDENFNKNFSVGFQLLKLIIDKGNEVNYIPWVVFRNQLNTQDVTEKIWTLVENRPFARKTSWFLAFFYNLDKSIVSKGYAISIIKMIAETEENIHIDLDSLAKFLKVDKKLFQKYSSCDPCKE